MHGLLYAEKANARTTNATSFNTGSQCTDKLRHGQYCQTCTDNLQHGQPCWARTTCGDETVFDTDNRYDTETVVRHGQPTSYTDTLHGQHMADTNNLWPCDSLRHRHDTETKYGTDNILGQYNAWTTSSLMTYFTDIFRWSTY